MDELELVIKDRLKHAVQALATDQPNLASLYIKRALEHVAELRQLMAAHRVIRQTTDVIAEIGRMFQEAFAPLIAGVKDVFEAFTKAFNQSDFALAAPQ